MATTAKTDTTTPAKPKAKRLTGAERIAKMEADVLAAKKAQAVKDAKVVNRLKAQLHTVEERIKKDSVKTAALRKQIADLTPDDVMG